MLRLKYKHPTPTPVEIVELRFAYGITQAQAAELVYTSLCTWQKWECGKAPMHPGLWELLKMRLKRNPPPPPPKGTSKAPRRRNAKQPIEEGTHVPVSSNV